MTDSSPNIQSLKLTDTDIDHSNNISNSDSRLTRNPSKSQPRRPPMDPMILALSSSKPPTHNHYHHDWFGLDSSGTRSKRLSVNHQSLQKPRKERLNDLKNEKKYTISRSLFYLRLSTYLTFNQIHP